MGTRILVVVEYIPEETKWYIVKNPNDQFVENLKKAQGFTVNSDKDNEREEAATQVILGLEEMTPELMENPVLNVDAVYWVGFAL